MLPIAREMCALPNMHDNLLPEYLWNICKLNISVYISGYRYFTELNGISIKVSNVSNFEKTF